jgi:hypothetical protein
MLIVLAGCVSTSKVGPPSPPAASSVLKLADGYASFPLMGPATAAAWVQVNRSVVSPSSSREGGYDARIEVDVEAHQAVRFAVCVFEKLDHGSLARKVAEIAENPAETGSSERAVFHVPTPDVELLVVVAVESPVEVADNRTTPVAGAYTGGALTFWARHSTGRGFTILSVKSEDQGAGELEATLGTAASETHRGPYAMGTTFEANVVRPTEGGASVALSFRPYLDPGTKVTLKMASIPLAGASILPDGAWA